MSISEENAIFAAGQICDLFWSCGDLRSFLELRKECPIESCGDFAIFFGGKRYFCLIPDFFVECTNDFCMVWCMARKYSGLICNCSPRASFEEVDDEEDDGSNCK